MCDLPLNPSVLLSSPIVLFLFFSSSPRGVIGIIPRRVHRGKKVDGQPGSVVPGRCNRRQQATWPPPPRNPGLLRDRRGAVLGASVGGATGVAPESTLSGGEGCGPPCGSASRAKTLFSRASGRERGSGGKGLDHHLSLPFFSGGSRKLSRYVGKKRSQRMDLLGSSSAAGRCV